MSNEVSIFTSQDSFTAMWNAAKIFSDSEIVPQSYKGKPQNCFVALNIAHDLRKNPTMVMQNLHNIQGRFSWSSAWCGMAINESGLYRGAIRHETEVLGEKTVDGIKIEDVRRRVQMTCRETGETVSGPWVSYEMAVKEKWWTKSGSKWQTMPDLMLTYRANAFFARTNCPQVLFGMLTQEEAQDIAPTAKVVDLNPKERTNTPVKQTIDADTPQEPTIRQRAGAVYKIIQDCKTSEAAQSAIIQNAELLQEFQLNEPLAYDKFWGLVLDIQQRLADAEEKADDLLDEDVFPGDLIAKAEKAGGIPL